MSWEIEVGGSGPYIPAPSLGRQGASGGEFASVGEFSSVGQGASGSQGGIRRR